MVYTTDFEIDKENIKKELDKAATALSQLVVEIDDSRIKKTIDDAISEALEENSKMRRRYFRFMKTLNWITFCLWAVTGVLELTSDGISKLSYGIIWGVLLFTFLTNAILHKSDNDIYVLTK